jgi:hypothetical protein
MKLLGFHNNNQIVASIARYDYISIGDGDDRIMMDGGQPHLSDGYLRFWGNKAWFEVPQTFAELYNDLNVGRPRKYGKWKLEDVRLLSTEEIPDAKSFEWGAENAIWGTNGKDGKSPTTYVLLKDCELDHLEKISELLAARKKIFSVSEQIEKTKRFVDFWIDKRRTIMNNMEEEQYTYNYYRYQGDYSKNFDTLEEAVRWGVDQEYEGYLSSHSITKGDEIVWSSEVESQTIFCLAEELDIEC